MRAPYGKHQSFHCQVLKWENFTGLVLEKEKFLIAQRKENLFQATQEGQRCAICTKGCRFTGSTLLSPLSDHNKPWLLEDSEDKAKNRNFSLKVPKKGNPKCQNAGSKNSSRWPIEKASKESMIVKDWIMTANGKAPHMTLLQERLSKWKRNKTGIVLASSVGVRMDDGIQKWNTRVNLPSVFCGQMPASTHLALHKCLTEVHVCNAIYRSRNYCWFRPFWMVA